MKVDHISLIFIGIKSFLNFPNCLPPINFFSLLCDFTKPELFSTNLFLYLRGSGCFFKKAFFYFDLFVLEALTFWDSIPLILGEVKKFILIPLWVLSFLLHWFSFSLFFTLVSYDLFDFEVLFLLSRLESCWSNKEIAKFTFDDFALLFSFTILFFNSFGWFCCFPSNNFLLSGFI